MRVNFSIYVINLSMRVIFACAGTGGHVNPAIAIARIIQKNEKDSEFLFIGTKNGLENKLVKNAGFEIVHIRTGKLLRKLTLKNVKAIFDTYAGIGESIKILKDFKPDLVIGTGGYICGPVMLAAKKLEIPYMLHESNAYPGVSVKLLAKKAKYVMLGFEDAKKRLKRQDNLIYTGTPAKFNIDEFDSLKKDESKKEFNIEKINKKIVLVTCGSQGAKKINETVIQMVAKKRSKEYFIVLVTGEATYDSMRKELDELKIENESEYIKLEKFIFNMDKMYKACDMCITRAGAMTITELALAARPAILVPLPTAAENHQYYNAKVLENARAGKIIEQKDLTIDLLDNTINEIICNNDKLREMSANARKMAKLDVEEKIYNCIKQITIQDKKIIK